MELRGGGGGGGGGRGGGRGEGAAWGECYLKSVGGIIERVFLDVRCGRANQKEGIGMQLRVQGVSLPVSYSMFKPQNIKY